MELLERLAETAKRQHREADLPASILARILALAAAPGRLSDEADIALLLQQVEDFDSYAGAGCFGDAVSAATLEATLKRFRDGS